MKKIWLIFALTFVIVAQVAFISSFHNVFDHSYVSNESAVIISKLNYATVRTTVNISLKYGAPPAFLIFSNGTRREITEDYTMTVSMPKSGNVIGDYSTGTGLGVSENSGEYIFMRLSKDNPIDIDVVPLPSPFLLWLETGQQLIFFENVDIFWFKIQGEAFVTVKGSGTVI